MTIARIFPTKTSMSPNDPDVYFDNPFLYTPNYDEVHISVTFTWDIPRARELAINWETKGKVKIGGCAFDDPGQEFIPGLYLKKGVVITSRGCPNHCSFCFVPKREGKIREIEVKEGNIIQDNNLLACSDRHINLVFDMLKNQKAIEFKGGLEKQRVTDKIAKRLSGLRIKELWLACDQANSLKPLEKAIKILNKNGFNQNKIHCFVLIGNDMIENQNRLREVYRLGAMPFAQLLRNENNQSYTKEWKQFARKWSRPAIIRSINKIVKGE